LTSTLPFATGCETNLGPTALTLHVFVRLGPEQTQLMIYAEAAYFDGAHVAHIAAWLDHERVKGIDLRVRARSSGQRKEKQR